MRRRWGSIKAKLAALLGAWLVCLVLALACGQLTATELSRETASIIASSDAGSVLAAQYNIQTILNGFMAASMYGGGAAALMLAALAGALSRSTIHRLLDVVETANAIAAAHHVTQEDGTSSPSDRPAGTARESPSPEAGAAGWLRSHDEVDAVADALARLDSRLRETTISKDALDGILAAIPDSVIVVEDGLIKRCNTATCTLLGRTHDDLVGSRYDVITQTPYQDHFRLRPWRRIGETWRTDTVYQDAQGDQHPVALSVTPSPSDSKLSLQFVCVARDISDRKQAEFKIHSMHAKLVRASREAGMAEVATNVLHNVGNVLNSVNTSAGVIRDKAEQIRAPSLHKAADLLADAYSESQEPSDSAQGTSVVTRRALRLPDFLRRLAVRLDTDCDALFQESVELCEHVDHIKRIIHSQQRAGRAHCVKEYVRPQALVESALSVAMAAPDAKGIRWEGCAEAAEHVGEVFVDRHRVVQILVKLLTNAKHATLAAADSISKTVTIRASADNDVMTIEVQDRGIGIPQENLARIFSHGFTTKERGSGFGLHASANAAREMGGSLCATSDGHNQGTVFTLKLPTIAEEFERDGPEVVLVIDDDPAVSRTVAIGLRSAGFEVSTADGHSALDEFETCRPDYVLTDMVMDGMDGLSLIRQLRDRRFVNIIAMSGAVPYQDQRRVAEVHAAGARVVLAKPMLIDEIIEALAQSSPNSAGTDRHRVSR